MTKAVTDVLDSLAETEGLYRAGEIEQASFRALTAAYLTTFLPSCPAVDGRPYDRSALLDLLDQDRPERLPDAAIVAAREHLAREEWTAAATVLNDLANLLFGLSRFDGEVAS